MIEVLAIISHGVKEKKQLLEVHSVSRGKWSRAPAIAQYGRHHDPTSLVKRRNLNVAQVAVLAPLHIRLERMWMYTLCIPRALITKADIWMGR